MSSSDYISMHKNESGLKKNFGIWSLFGLSFGLSNTWMGVGGSLGTGIASGGPLLIIYGLIIAFFFSMCVAVTLSELISALPNSGAQYYWALKLSPAKYNRFISYFTGTIAYFGSVFTVASIVSSVATQIIGIYSLAHPQLLIKKWHFFILYQLLNIFISTFNLWSKLLPFFTSFALYFSLIAFLVTSITTLLFSSGQYTPPKFLFGEFQNVTGWKNSGIAYIVGLINPIWGFSGIDAASHMVDELDKTRSRVLIPRVITGTVFLGFVTGFSYSISLFFCIGNRLQVVSAEVPLLEIFYQATENKTVAIFLMCLCIISGSFCLIVANTWQARICWSFSRDKGLPGSTYWRKINSNLRLPINAHFFSTFLVSVTGCIYLGSDTAFNAIITASICLLLVSYSIPTICLLLHNRKNLKHGPFWLGNLGLFCNIMVVLWTIFCLVFLSFPYVMPVNGGNMNYVSVVYGIVFLYTMVYWWVRGRRIFKEKD